MQGLEAASDEADHLLHTANKRPCSVPHSVEKNGKFSASFFSIHQKLRQLYEEEVAKTSEQPLQNLRPSSHLLEKLVEQENLNTLVLNLYPGNKGYSLCLKMGGDNMLETAKFPYQEDQLLSYIDNEELPPAVADLLERSHPEVYYSGCVIVQIRDYRQTFPHYMCDTHHVLLRPSTQSVINDVNLITSEGEWTPDERLLLESQLVLATQGPLCLEPSPAVGLAAQRVHHTRHALNTSSLRSAARRHSQIAVNRKRKLDQFTTKPLPHLADFLARRKSQPTRHTGRTQQTTNNAAKQQKKDDQQPQIDYWADVHRFAKPLERPLETLDCTPLLVEEYILETERGPGRVYYIKLSILQRPSNCEYLGQLYVDKEYREGESNGASCRFSLGSRAQANRYIQQFTEIFTEEGRKSVRITHVVPGQPARVICTAGMRERDAKMAAQSLLQQQQQTLKQVLTAMSQQQMKLQKAVQAQKEQLVQVPAPSQTQVQIQVPNVSGHLGQSSETCSNSVLSNVTLNGLGLMSSLNPTSSHNGSVSNGDVAPKLTHAPVAVTQPSKPVIMTNPAISALANDLKNSVQQYQQQAAAAAAANAAATAAAAANAAANTANSSVNFVNHHSSSASNNHGNTAILSLLNSNTSTSATSANPTLNHLLNNVITSTPQQQQTLNQKLLTRKMTLTNILNSRLLTPSSNTTAPSPVRVSLSSLTNQLSSPPLAQPKLATGRIVQATISSGSVQTQSQTVQTLAPANVQYSGSGNVQSIRRLSAVSSQDTSPTATVPATSLGLSMPGLSALLAGTPSADNPVPGAGSSGSTLLERLSTPPSYPSSSPKPPPAPSPSSLNLNLASLQGAMASIPGLQNVQVSIPGLAVPISVSLNVSTPHIVTSLPVTATPISMTTANIAAVTVSGSTPGATMVFTNSNQAQLLTPGKSSNTQPNLKTSTPGSACNLTGGPSIQLVGTLQRQRGVVTTTNKPTLMTRSVVNTQRHTLKVAPANAVVSSGSPMSMATGNTQVLTISPQQHLQIQALQKQAQLQLQQCLNQQVQQQPSAIAVKPRRRSNTADNK